MEDNDESENKRKGWPTSLSSPGEGFRVEESVEGRRASPLVSLQGFVVSVGGHESALRIIIM